MTKNIHLYLFLTAIFIAFNACSTSADDNSDYIYNDSFNNTSSYTSPVVLRINSEAFKTINTNRLNNINTGDSFKINSAKRTKDILEVSVSYGGGCKSHTFDVIWDGVVYTDSPCNINLIITHNANKDNCEALITETLSINLKDLIGDNDYKDNCNYNIFTSYNTTKTADVTVKK